MQSIKKAGGYVTSATKAVIMFPLATARFAALQAAGTWRNFRGFLGWLTIDNALPPTITSTIRWAGEKIPLALGAGSSYEQTAAAAVFIIGAVTATILTLGLTAAVVVAAVPFLLIGLWRFVPAVNAVWKGQVQSRTDDLPRWDR